MGVVTPSAQRVLAGLMSYLLSILPILTGFICILLALFLVLTPSQRKLANRFFAVFLILTAIDVSGWLWVGNSDLSATQNGIRASFSFLQMPVFLGFILATCYSDIQFRKRDVLHLLPFAVALLMVFPGQQIPGVSGSDAFQLSFNEWLFLNIATHIQYYAYIAVCVVVLWRFRKIFRQQHSGSRSATFQWLSQLVAVSIFAHTLSLIRNVIGYAEIGGAFEVLRIIGALLVLGIVAWITLKTLLEPDLFRKVDRTLLKASADLEARRSGGQETNDSRQKLLAHMATQQPYLDPGLTLQELADQLALLPRELSELINSSFGTHFFDFVNRHRIEAAKAMLRDESEKQITEILYAVGFNSKSSFNTAFKKETGSTPSAWRRAQVKSAS